MQSVAYYSRTMVVLRLRYVNFFLMPTVLLPTMNKSSSSTPVTEVICICALLWIKYISTKPYKALLSLFLGIVTDVSSTIIGSML